MTNEAMKTVAVVVALIGAVGVAAGQTSGAIASAGTSKGVGGSAATSATTATTTSRGRSEKGSEPAPAELAVARLVVGTSVSEREPVGVASSFAVSAQPKLLAFVELANPKKEATTVELAWVDVATGKDRGQFSLEVGASKRWRTWATSATPKKAGEYAVVVRDLTTGVELARTPFTITP